MGDTAYRRRLVQEAHQLLESLDILYRRMGHGPDGADDPLTESDPYNDKYVERIDQIYGRAVRRLERRQARLARSTRTDAHPE